MTDSRAQTRVDPEHPWPALLAFREDDQRFFGGRKKEVEALYRRIVASRLTLLFGLSGLGKSSLLRAGLFPRLRGERYFPIYIRLRYGRDLPSPIEQIQSAIVAQARLSRIEAPEPRADETLWQYFHRPDADFWDARNHPSTPVLVFDQFEELFTKGREVPEHADHVIEELADLAEGAGDPSLLRQAVGERYRLLIGIRSDYLAQLQGISDRVRAVFANRYELHRMSGAAALESTLTAGGHLMEEEVARRIVQFVAGARQHDDALSVDGLEVEPALLSLVCSELNATRVANGEPKITASMLSGTKDEILSRFYESSFADIAPELRVLVEDKLVTRDGKSRNFISEQTALEAPGVTDEDLAKLVRRRLLRLEESGSSRRMELTHDLLTTVAAASRSSRENRMRIEEAQRAQAEAEEREASARQALRRSRAAMLIFFVLLATAVAGPFIAARWTATGAKKIEADSAFRLALQKLSSDEPSEGLAYLARVIRLDQGNSAARTLLYEQLITRSWPVPMREFGPTGRIDSAVVSDDGARIAFRLGKTVEMWDIARGERIAKLDAGSKPGPMTFSADNWTIRFERNSSSSAPDAEPALWNPRARRLMTFADIGKLAGHSCQLQVFEVSANGEELAVDCNGLSILSLRGDRPIEKILDTYMFAGTVRFAPDPRFAIVDYVYKPMIIDRQVPGDAGQKALAAYESVAAVSKDSKRVLIIRDHNTELDAWDVQSWTSAGLTLTSQSPIRSAMFDGTGRKVMTVGEDDGIRLWNAAEGRRLFAPLSHPEVKVAAFSADDARILTASDRVARWWRAQDGEQLGAAIVQPKLLLSHLDAHGNIVTVANKARVWTLASTVLPPVLAKGTRARQLSADGKTVISDLTAYDTASGKSLWTAPRVGSLEPDPQFARAIARNGETDLSVMEVKSWKTLWTLESKELLWSSWFSDDGSAVLVTTVTIPTALTVYSAATGKPLAPPVTLEGRLAGESHDASLLAIQSDGKLQVWDVRERRAALTIAEDDDVKIDFSPDGRRLATVSSREGLRMWDLASGKSRSAKPNDESEKLVAPKFSPNGRRLAVTSENGVVLCSSARTLDCDDELLAHAGVKFVEFSADGRRIITDTDEDLRVWDVPTKRPLSLSLPRSSVPPAAFSPDGNFVFGSDHFALYRVPLPSIDDDDAERLATIGEALAGVRIDRLGVTASVDGIETLTDLENECVGVNSRACALVRWLRMPAIKRTISPLSPILAADYVKTADTPGTDDWWKLKASFPDALQAKPPQ